MPDNKNNYTCSNNECIWSASGILQFNLCHLQFDCDNCEIDMALRSKEIPGIERRTPEGKIKGTLDLVNGGRKIPPFFKNHYKLLAGLFDDFSDIPYIKDAYYFPSHIWMYLTSTQTAVVGIDGFLSKCLDPVEKVIFPLTSKIINKNSTFCWLFFKDWNLGLSMPFSAVVKGINSTILQYPGEVLSSPLSHGWLLEIEGDVELPEMISKAQLSELYTKKMKVLIDELAEKYPLDRDRLGATMQDGGKQIKNISQLLGRDSYIRLIKKFVNEY